MKNGCPECEKLDENTLCDMCELEMLEQDVDTAFSHYVAKVNDILKKKENEK